MSKLAEICAAKREEVDRRKALMSIAELDALAAEQSPPRGFRAALETASAGGYALIAEIKRASPSKGLIRRDFDPPAHAQAYQAGGATCLSVLTDAPFFQGADADLIAARAACELPVLRKDFMIDPWQVAEARAIGADAILVIAAALDDREMGALDDAARERGMDVLVEVHDAAEMDRATDFWAKMIGINNRNLNDFSVDLATTEQLAPLAPAGALLIAESGVATRGDLDRLAKAGVRAFLVGEALMRAPDLEAATRRLLTGQ